MTRRSHLVAIVVFLFLLAGVFGPCLAAPTGADPAAPENPAGEAGEKGAAEADETPGLTGTPEPTVDPKAAEEACKKSVAGLRTGDFSALEALPENERNALLSGPTGVRVLTCLAIGEDNKSRCDLLEEDAKKACLDQWNLGSELRKVPREQMKAQLLYRACVSSSGGADCELLREAVGTGDAAKCKDLKDASRRTICTAIASGDAKKCDGVKESAERAYCAAFATDDATRCPKEATDCIAMARGFAAIRKGGLDTFRDIDATIAAATLGTKACGALLDEAQKSCSKDE